MEHGRQRVRRKRKRLFGAPMTTGTDCLANHNNGQYQSSLAAVTDMARADGMASVYWAGLKTGDSYSMETHSGSGLTNNNASASPRSAGDGDTEAGVSLAFL